MTLIFPFKQSMLEEIEEIDILKQFGVHNHSATYVSEKITRC